MAQLAQDLPRPTETVTVLDRLTRPAESLARPGPESTARDASHARAAPSFLEQGTPEASPTPTIEISIGRVEVRAEVASPKPARQHAPAQPILSLDAYLGRQRKGGK